MYSCYPNLVRVLLFLLMRQMRYFCTWVTYFHSRVNGISCEWFSVWPEAVIHITWWRFLAIFEWIIKSEDDKLSLSPLPIDLFEDCSTFQHSLHNLISSLVYILDFWMDVKKWLKNVLRASLHAPSHLWDYSNNNNNICTLSWRVWVKDSGKCKRVERIKNIEMCERGKILNWKIIPPFFLLFSRNENMLVILFSSRCTLCA